MRGKILEPYPIGFHHPVWVSCASASIRPRFSAVAIRPNGKRPSDYTKGPRERGFRRVVSVDLEDPRFDAVFQYAAEVAPNHSVQDSIRDLLLQAVASNPSDAAIREARRQAYRDVHARSQIAISLAFKALSQELALDPAEESAGVQPENFIAVG